MTDSGKNKGRSWRALGALMLAVGSLAAAGVAPARADPAGPQACQSQGASVNCIQIHWTDPWTVRAGIDVTMSQELAQQIIECSGGNPFWGEVWGDDGDDGQQYRGYLPVVPGMVSAWEGGLSAELSRVFAASDLDEDGPSDNPDEIFIRIYVHDCVRNRELRFETLRIEHDF